MVTDTHGNLLSGAHVTAVVAGKALRGKDATSFTATTGSNGYFVIPNVPVVNVVNNNQSDTGGALSLSVEAPAGYMSATVAVYPQAQVTSSEGNGSGSGVQGGDTNPQVIWFDHFNANAGTVELPAFNATITGILRNSTTGTPITGFPLRAQWISKLADECSNPDDVDCSDPSAGGTGVVVSYASIGTILATTEGSTGVAGRFFFNNVPTDSCIRIIGPGLNFVAPPSSGATSEDFSGAVCENLNDPGQFFVNGINISTQDDFVQLNRVFANNSETKDEIKPFVTAVDNASFVTGPCGTLSSAAGNTIVVHFSEPVTVTGAVGGANPITVLIGAFPNFTFDDVTAATLSSDGTTLTLTLADPLPTTSDVNVDIPIEDVADLAGNPLAEGPGVGFDSIVSTTSGNCPGPSCSVENVVDQLCFNTFAPGTQPTGAFTLTQVSPAENADGGPDNLNLNLLFDSTSALIDTVANGETSPAVDDTGAIVCFATTTGTCTSSLGLDPDDIDQFNAFQDNPRTGSQLDALATALNNGTSVNVHTHVARVHIGSVPTGTVNFAVAVIDSVSGQPKDALFFPVRTTAGGGNPTALGEVADGKALITTINNGGVHWFSIAPNGATEFDIVVAGDSVGNPDKPNPGDIFVAIARGQTSGGAFVLGPAAQVTLNDKVPPTVALQLLALANTTGSSLFGEGGVVVFNASNVGEVVLPITPQALDTVDTNNGSPTGYSGDNYIPELYNHSGLAAQGIPNGASTATLDTAGQTRVDTDATGVDFLIAHPSAPVAVAVDEHVQLTGAAIPLAYAGSAHLTAPTTLDSVPNENNTAFNDLVVFTVDNVFTLANVDGAANTELDMTGGIKDLAGNVADAAAHATVLVQDFFPPIVKRGFFDGKNLEFKFNEPILLHGHLQFYSCTAIQRIDLEDTSTPLTPITLSADGTVLTIPDANFLKQTTVHAGACFNNTASFSYSEAPDYLPPDITAQGMSTSLASVDTTPRHGFVGYRDVEDAQGNIWDCSFISKVSCVTPTGTTFVWSQTGLGIGAPVFAMADILGPFQPILVQRGVNYTTGVNKGVTSETVNITIEFSHPFYLTDTFGVVTQDCGAPHKDKFGDNPDCPPFGNQDKSLNNAELLAWGKKKFAYVVGATTTYPLTGIQILDGSLTDILVAGGNPQDARRVILTFQLGGDVKATDQVTLQTAEGLESNLDRLQHVYPFDEGVGGEPNSTTGEFSPDTINDLNELLQISPAPAALNCPQSTFPDGGATQC